MRRRRVKITGIGPVTPAGIGRDAFWQGILQGQSYIRPFSALGEENGPFVAAHVDDFDIGDYMPRATVPKGAARHTLFAIAGAVLALRDAGISKSELTATNCLVATGSSIMDFGGVNSAIDTVARKGHRGVQPRVLFAIGLGSVPSTIAEVLGIDARSVALSTQCDSGMDAVGYAAQMIATGEFDMAICGGTEAPLHKFPLLELRAAGLTPPTTQLADRLSRPFDLWRTTGVVSEGACIFVLEAESSARAPYAYISGYASSNDQGDLCGGLELSGKLAIAEARLRPEDIDSINAWGPGHKLVDAGEARAMMKLFGNYLPEIPVVSIKGSIGTPLGGAPAIQIAAAALGQKNGVIPPTVNWQFPDPACPLNLSNEPRAVAHGRTLINAHGLGGVNSTIIVQQC
jgi:3-oxoacyl-[acyl-carrier-protein] synthase II